MTDTMQLRKQNSGGFGSSGSSQENLSNVMYNAANYNTIMVEYENGNREMAVDVPASFVAQVITIIIIAFGQDHFEQSNKNLSINRVLVSLF